jgi:hypothetical protein
MAQEFLLIIWLGGFHGGPAMERFPTKDECERVAAATFEALRSLSWGLGGQNHVCIAVDALASSPRQ